MPNKLITLALIGVGQWGKNYLDSCNGLSDVKIGYVCTKSQKKLDELPARYRKTTNIKDLLNIRDISGFIIASPTSTHFKIAKLLIKNNKNILIEKPVTNSLNKTKLLYNISQKHPNVIVMPGHIQLYDSGYMKLKKNISKVGIINKFKYEGLQSPKRRDVSVFWDWLPHPLYLFFDITQAIPKVISVKFIKPDNLEITVLLKNYIAGKIHVGWTYPIRKRSFTVIGKKGTLSLKPLKSKFSPLQNELLTFADCINRKTQPPSNLKQALEIAETISKIEGLTK